MRRSSWPRETLARSRRESCREARSSERSEPPPWGAPDASPGPEPVSGPPGPPARPDILCSLNDPHGACRVRSQSRLPRNPGKTVSKIVNSLVNLDDVKALVNLGKRHV